MKINQLFLALSVALFLVVTALGQEAPLGSIAPMSGDEKKALDGLKGKISVSCF